MQELALTAGTVQTQDVILAGITTVMMKRANIAESLGIPLLVRLICMKTILTGKKILIFNKK